MRRWLLVQLLLTSAVGVQRQVIRTAPSSSSSSFVGGALSVDDNSSRPEASLAALDGQAPQEPLTAVAEAEAAGADKSTWSVLYQSFCLVAVAELFDKTWFVAVLCSLSQGKRIAFVGSVSALFLHVGVAAGLGVAISRVFAVHVLHFITAAVFAFMSAMYFWEWSTADADANAIEERSQEAKEALGGSLTKPASTWSKLSSCFIAVFIAEWGDRTQITMISLHSSLPVVPVCLGSLAAFVALSASAVLVAACLEGTKLSERFIAASSAIVFLIFTIIALVDGIEALQAEHKVLAAKFF